MSSPDALVPAPTPLAPSLIQFQPELTAELAAIVSAKTGHLCIAGPPGLGQGLAARIIASNRCPSAPVVVHIIPADLAAGSLAESLDRLRKYFAQAANGVLYLSELENLFGSMDAVPLLGTLRDLSKENPSVSLILSGDLDAISKLHALSPETYMLFTHVVVKNFSLQQMACLLAEQIADHGVKVDSEFITDAVPLLRRVRAVGNLRNSRVVNALLLAALRSSSSTQAAGRGLRPADIDPSGLRLLSEAGPAEFGDLDDLVGLTDVKKTVRLWVANSRLSVRREQLGLISSGMSQHMIFKGQAGTAKTTVARIVGQILAQTGVLSSGHLVEVHRADLISEQLELTSRRVVEVVKRALGGVLFIDEAYTLTASEGVRDAGREVIETLLNLMEDYREEFVVIAAGYPLEMEQFLESNPGLRSRFARVLDFPAYSPIELLDILDHQAAQRGYKIDLTVRSAFESRLELVSQYPGFGNGRHMRNMLENAIMRQAYRVTPESSDEDLRRLMLADFSDPTAAPSR